MKTGLILGAPNINARAAGLTDLASVGTLAAGRPVTNLRTAQPWQSARWTDLRYESTAAYALYRDAAYPVDGAGIVAHNLSRGATVRLLAFDGQSEPFEHASVVAPDAVLSSSGFTGALSTIASDPRTEDGTWMTSSGAATVRCSFGSMTSSHVLATGSTSQLFLIRARRAGSSSGSPTLTARLRQSGAAVGSLGSVVVDTNAGALYAFAWDGSSVSDATGAGVEIEIECTAAGAARIDLNGLAWIAYQIPDFVSVVGDTGWLTVPRFDGDAEWADLPTDEEPPTQTALLRFGERAEGVAQLVLLIRDPDNADGFLDIGVWPAGVIWSPAQGVDEGALLGLRPRTAVLESVGGSKWGSRLLEPRRFPLVFGALSSSEAVGLHERVIRRKGRLGPVLVSVLPEDATTGPALCAWCTVAEADDLIASNELSPEGSTVWRASVLFEEAL